MRSHSHLSSESDQSNSVELLFHRLDLKNVAKYYMSGQQHGGGKNSLLNAPRHMVKTSIPGTSRGGNTNATRAAAGAAKHKRPPLTRAGKDVFGDALLRGQMKSSGGNDRAATTRTSLVPRAKPKERKVATFGGYSGSVQVPQPSRSLFGDVPVSQHLASSSSIAVTPSLNPAEVRERQRQVAEQVIGVPAVVRLGALIAAVGGFVAQQEGQQVGWGRHDAVTIYA